MASLQQCLRSLTFRAAEQFQGAVKRMSLFVGSEVKRSEEDSMLSCVEVMLYVIISFGFILGFSLTVKR